MVNILSITTDFGQGGAEKVFSQLGRELGTRYRVVDVVFNRMQAQQYPSGNELVDLQTPRSDSVFSKAFYFFLRIYRLRKLKLKYDAGISISHLEGADYINVLSRANEKVILCIHGSKQFDQNIKGPLGWFRKKILIPFLYKRADHIITVSEGIRQELISRFGLPGQMITVINNFIDTESLQRMAMLGLPDQCKSIFDRWDILINSGRLAVQKNQQFLIDIMPAVIRENPRARLVVLGDGELYASLRTRAEKLGLRVNARKGDCVENCDVLFLGYQTNPFNYIAKAKLFLLSSLWEGFPLALCEAMICGTAVVSNDCPTGPREIIAPASGSAQTIITECGALIPLTGQSQDSLMRSWVATIIELLANTSKREELEQRARRRMDNFRKDEIMKKWFTVLERYAGE